MFVFGLHSTSDDGRAIRVKTLTKTQKMKKAPKSSKNKMFILGLHSTFDDQLSNLSKNIDQNRKK